MRPRRKAYYKSVTMTGSDVALSDDSLRISFWIEALSTNGSNVTLSTTSDTSQSVSLTPDTFSPFHDGIDLSTIVANGTSGDIIQIWGYTPCD